MSAAGLLLLLILTVAAGLAAWAVIGVTRAFTFSPTCRRPGRHRLALEVTR